MIKKLSHVVKDLTTYEFMANRERLTHFVQVFTYEHLVPGVRPLCPLTQIEHIVTDIGHQRRKAIQVWPEVITIDYGHHVMVLNGQTLKFTLIEEISRSILR